MLDRRQALGLLGGGLVGLALRPRRARANIQLKAYDTAAAALLSRALDDSSFWTEADIRTYDKELYDEVRLKDLDEGYLAMVTGEGNQDFAHDTVVRTVFENMELLPTVEDGAIAVQELGSGTDSRTGLPYRDSFYMLDFNLFYGTYGQRMYKRVDGDRTILYFERLTEQVAGSAWASYKPRMDAIVEEAPRRVLFNGVQEVSEIFGMFVVSPGTRHTSRVTFTTQIRFGQGTGAIARLGSQMPPVIRSGLRSGFDSCVAIASKLKGG